MEERYPDGKAKGMIALVDTALEHPLEAVLAPATVNNDGLY